MAETRAWLLERHGPVCAYCGGRYTARKMTLDHVAPRRGQSAYDRRDNLVLACPACNVAKRDIAPLAFLLASRRRAHNLVKYGDHLSHGLLELAKSLVSSGTGAGSNGSGANSAGHGNGRRPSSRELFGALSDEGESPYSD